MICPKCSHKRTEHDDPLIPDYQCPACGIVYAKFGKKLNKPTEKNKSFTETNPVLQFFKSKWLALIAYDKELKQHTFEDIKTPTIRTQPVREQPPKYPIPNPSLYDKPTPNPYKIPQKNQDILHLPEQFIVFDLETTGLDPYHDQIIELAAIKVNRDSNNHELLSHLVKPTIKIPSRATQINGITQKMVDENGKSIDEVLPEFIEFIGNLRLVAYNAKFDMSFIKAAAEKQGLKITNKHSCALKMARRAWPGLDSYKLESIAKIGGIDTSVNHRASKDCELAATVYMAAAAKLKTK